MGYLTYYTGSISCEPHLDLKDVNTSTDGYTAIIPDQYHGDPKCCVWSFKNNVIRAFEDEFKDYGHPDSIGQLKLIVTQLKTKGYTLNGSVEWHGVDSNDLGKIVITDNNFEVFDGIVEIKYKLRV